MSASSEKENKKDKILKAAKKLFLKQGFAGASMGGIAKEAAVTKSLLYHHFESKEDLWRGVKDYLFAEHFKTTTEEKPYANFHSFREYLEYILGLRFDLYTNNPEVPQLISWESLQGNSSSTLQGTTTVSPKAWIPAIKHFQAQDLIRDDIPAEELIIFISSLISGSSIRMINNLYKGTERKAYLANIIDLIDRALRP